MWERVFGRFWEHARGFAASLAPSQRIAIVVLATVVVLGLVFVTFFSGQREFTALARHKDAGELQRMAQKLHAAGYGVRVENGAVEVKRTQLPQALNFVASDVASTPRRDGWAWLDQDPQWGDTSVRLTEKVKRAKTINLEESIKVCPDIVDAIVELNMKREPLTVLGGTDGGNSASVIVTLAPGVGRLTSAQVRTIRNIVSGGAPIPFAAVKVTDNRLNAYAQDDEEGGGAEFDERRLAHVTHYKREIAAYMERTFRECEYSLFVDVKLDREKTESDAELIAPPAAPLKVKEREHVERIARGGDGVPASAAAETEDRRSSEVEYSPLVGRTRDRTVKPAGAIQELSVAVRVDKSAVERVVAALHAGTAAAESKKDGAGVADFCKEMEGEIRTMLAIQGKVNVSVLPGVLRVSAASVEERAPVVRTMTAGQWVSAHATLIACVLFTIAALGFVYTLARRSVPPPIEIPPAELPEENAAAAENIAELALEDEEFSRGLTQISALAKDRSGVAANVVKMWIDADARTATEQHR